METYSLYLHIPFCTQRCAYCDFNTYSGKGNLIPGYVHALETEIRSLGAAASSHLQRRAALHTLYFGGGTPSLLHHEQVCSLIQAAGEEFELGTSSEITLEANPDSVQLEQLQGYLEAGVNRVSLGVQSFLQDELQTLGRLHSAEEARAALEAVRESGFQNLSLDLIYGIPGQTLESWEQSLREAVRQMPQHLSLYSLTVEPGTPLEKRIERRMQAEPDPDLMADMYELASELLSTAGYDQYEISNWAVRGSGSQEGLFPTYASRHNLQYWLNQPYLGVGAGASGFAAGYRTRTVLRPADYIRRMHLPGQYEFPFSAAVVERERIDRQREMEDTLMMGFRLTGAGVGLDRFASRFGAGLQDLYGDVIAGLVDRGLLEWTPGALRLTGTGRLLGNQVFAAFIS